MLRYPTPAVAVTTPAWRSPLLGRERGTEHQKHQSGSTVWRLCQCLMHWFRPHIVHRPPKPRTTLQRTREQFLDVPVPRRIEQVVDVPKIVCQDRIRDRRQQNIENPVDDSISQIMEEIVEVVKTVSAFSSAVCSCIHG